MYVDCLMRADGGNRGCASAGGEYDDCWVCQRGLEACFHACGETVVGILGELYDA